MKHFVLGLLFTALPVSIYAGVSAPSVAGIKMEFIFFALTLAGIAFFHNYTMQIALSGLIALIAFIYFTQPGFSLYSHILGNNHHEGEWKTIVNLIGLLFGFGILAKLFEESKIPEILPNYLPDDWKGGFVLLLIIMLISSFLDNIAAAMIGGTMAMVVFNNRVHIGFIAAIIAASNAGGAGSVVGDTTTTIMWIDGVSPLSVIHAFIASFAAFFVFGIIGSKVQHRYQPIQKDTKRGVRINLKKLVVVGMILTGAILTNYFLDLPAIGVWIALVSGYLLTPIPWSEIKHAFTGTLFLCSLVLIASLMPVEELPSASWQSTLALGFVSAVFDNIPLTKLCLEQGNYDWGILAYAVGFGGSMIWFGSSSGVALSSMFPESRSVFNYIKQGWFVILAYVIGFFTLYLLLGWNPSLHR